MKDLFTNKLMIIFAAAAAGLSLLLGLIAGVGAGRLILQTLLSGVLFGALGIGVTSLVKKFIPEDTLNELLGKSGTEADTGKNVDMTDDSEMSADELYASDGDGDSNSSGGNGMTFKIDEDGGDVPSAPPGYDDDSAGSSGGDDFEETDFSSAPKVSSGSAEQDDDDEDTLSDEEALIKSEMNRMKEKAKSGESLGGVGLKESSSIKKGSDGSFKVGNKKISADPKIIAKAIKTVLSRE